MPKLYKSHGDGQFCSEQFEVIGQNCIFEVGVLVFHPENIRLGENIYIGHNSILKGYHKNKMSIGDNTWIGQGCFFHSAGGIRIGKNVGIGPAVKILTSKHEVGNIENPILFNPIEFMEVEIGDGSDLGVGTIVMPGVTIGKGVQVGAGSVVTSNLPDYSIAVGVPARVIRYRDESLKVNS